MKVLKNQKNFLRKKMPDLEVTIYNQKLKLSYQENEKQRLINAVKILNENWNKYSHLHGKVSDLKIITIISLEIQDSLHEIQALKDKINLQELNSKSLKNEIEIKNKEFEDNLKTINKFKSEIDNKNQEISNIENKLDEIQDQVLKIKSNFLANNYE